MRWLMCKLGLHAWEGAIAVVGFSDPPRYIPERECMDCGKRQRYIPALRPWWKDVN